MLQRQTNSTKNTIWRPINQIEFFNNVKRVHDACGDAPQPPRVFDRKLPANASAHMSSYQLPLEVEYQLANDFAFLAAAYEGAKSVTATTLTEDAQSTGLTLTVASNAGVSEAVEVALRQICQELQRCSSSGIHRRVCLESLFDIITKLHRQRILGRIESRYWTPPAHIGTRPREAFCEKFFQSMQTHIGTRGRNNSELSAVLQASKDLQESMDRQQGDKDLDGLKNLVKMASRLSGTYHSLAERLLGQNMAVLAQLKLIKTVDKIGRYWACCVRMVKMVSSRSYGYLFKKVAVMILLPYEPRIVLNRARHTHAEVQIITYFRLRHSMSNPRVIGISKATCYLCNLFLSHHPQYLVSATHGVIYEPWTIPDLDTYSTGDRIEIRFIIASMKRELVRQAKKRSKFPAPAQSGIFHPPPQFSASPASSRATILSRTTENTVRGLSVLDSLSQDRLNGASNMAQETHAGPYSQEERSRGPPAHIENTSRTASHLQTISLLHLDPASHPSPRPEPSSSEFSVVSTPCPSPRISNDSYRTHNQLEVPEAPTAPGISASAFDLRLESLTSEEQDWFELYGIRLGFELEPVGSGRCIYPRETPMGTAFVRRIFEAGIPSELNVIDVQTMVPGLDVILEKAERAESLDFVLSNGSKGALQVACQWHNQET